PLPVALITFTAKATTEGALINWSTATELSNDKFIIEKSLDGKTFSKLTEVAAKGSGNYSYTDKNLSASAYYRLVQVDLGGKTTVYNDMIRYVSTSGQSVSVYPNPTVSFVNINLNTIANDVINVKVTDGLGKLINNITEVGNQSIKIDLRNQKAGVYFIQLTKNNEVSYHKVVKQ
ncbi:T9SS type A sorting domain-containing protein, partial [Pseudopedobacter sp.]|uniref:T9SS type A sorting domain-containing protein n=1 Tax=Pseudopedobacter sp. TaxID=1936787 RepID=UPI00333F5E7F